MRRNAKVDHNQKRVVQALRSSGCSVESLAAVGKGVPDLLVGFRGQNFLVEVKDGAKPPSKRKLTPDQVTWHSEWRGQKAVVCNETEALTVVGAIK